MTPERMVECVPNFSEGRDPDVIRAITAAINSVPGVYLLDEEHDADHHRAVMTMAGEPDAVLEATLRSMAVAVERIDLNRHHGVHPRIGALDVLPFVPVAGISMEECAQLAREAAERIWNRFRVPCYLYEAAAQGTARRNLEVVRKGQFEQLREAVKMDPTRRPDVGGPELHPTAGATAVSARKFLIAWNVWLRTEDLTVSQQIAKVIRQSSGGFPCVKALGLPLASRGLTQVSLNLTDFEKTPPGLVFDAIAAEASRRHVEVLGSELIGLVPRSAVDGEFREKLRWMNFRESSILENRIDAKAAQRQREQAATASTPERRVGY